MTALRRFARFCEEDAVKREDEAVKRETKKRFHLSRFTFYL